MPRPHAMDVSERESEEPIWVPVYLPPGIGPESATGRELTEIILNITQALAPNWGIELATDLAHFCVIELVVDVGRHLFHELQKVSAADIQRARRSLTQ